MLSREQRDEVVKLFSEGRGASEIAKLVGISRQTVYCVIRDDYEQDAEINALKKQVKKEELNKRIWELKEPMRTGNELAVMKDEIEEMKNKMANMNTDMANLIDGLMMRVLALWFMNPDLSGNPPKCLYCGGVMKYVEGRKEGRNIHGYQCNDCEKGFHF